MKTCNKCHEEKPLTEFRNHPNTKDGKAGDCTPCRNLYRKAWRQANEDKQKAQNHRDRLKKYGLTSEDYERLLEEQGGRCPICHVTEGTDGYGEWSIDHDHDTGFVRGLLCGHCNRALGLFRDDPESLRRAASYLEDAQDKLKVAKG